MAAETFYGSMSDLIHGSVNEAYYSQILCYLATENLTCWVMGQNVGAAIRGVFYVL